MRVEWNLMWVYWALWLPLVIGLLAAWPFWMKRVTDELGSIVGCGFVFIFALAFVAREYGEVEMITRKCVDAGIGCHFHPTPFIRYGAFAGIALSQVFLIFLAGLSVEERLRRRESTWK
jgi:hypothetical protein